MEEEAKAGNLTGKDWEGGKGRKFRLPESRQGPTEERALGEPAAGGRSVARANSISSVASGRPPDTAGGRDAVST